MLWGVVAADQGSLKWVQLKDGQCVNRTLTIWQVLLQPYVEIRTLVAVMGSRQFSSGHRV
jgi:hypothetical protein